MKAIEEVYCLSEGIDKAPDGGGLKLLDSLKRTGANVL